MVETSTIIETAKEYIYTIILSTIILLVGFILGILAKKFIYRILKEIELNTILKVIGIHSDLEKWISSIISYLIYFIPNFVAWIILQRKQHLKVGMKIEIKEIAGEIEKIGCLETEIRTKHDDILYVPNSLFMKSKFKIKKNK